jgi:hypothetical protein
MGSLSTPATAKRLVRLRVEDVKDGSGEQRGTGFDPVIVEAAAVRIDDHVHDVLNVFGFVIGSEAHLFERGVLDARARGVGRIELQANVAHLFTPASGERPIFALEIVNQRRMRPSQKSGYRCRVACDEVRAPNPV